MFDIIVHMLDNDSSRENGKQAAVDQQFATAPATQRHQHLIDLIPDRLKLSTTEEGKVRGLFEIYFAHERLVHLVANPIADMDDPDDIEYVMKEFLSRFFGSEGVNLYALGGPKGHRGHMNIDDLLRSWEYVSTYLTFPPDLLTRGSARWVLPDGEPGIMACILKPEVFQALQMRAFSVEDTADLADKVNDDPSVLDMVTLSYSDLQELRRTLLCCQGVDAGKKDVPGIASGKVRKNGDYTVFDPREVQIPDIVLGEMIDKIVVKGSFWHWIEPYLDTVMVGNRPLREVAILEADFIREQEGEIAEVRTLRGQILWMVDEVG